jgi:tetratricopeptide (TPR) repeat protein
MADIFISYTSSDRDWAFWIGHELEALGHVPHVHEWEIPAGGDIMAWMEQRHHAADHILCVVSKAYLEAPYSSMERRAAHWVAASKRPGFALPVFVESCEGLTLFATLKRCDLYGLSEEDARERLKTFLAPVGKPAERPIFPRTKQTLAQSRPATPFPGKIPLSNIPISVPRHFIGRDDALKAIATALADTKGPVAITALHGLRGVGKTTLAAAYAERHRADYRATWWIRAQTPDGTRADLVALGVRLGWVAAEEKEEPAFKLMMERLRDEGTGILLIYDNVFDADALEPYLPSGGAARVLVTSNAPAWRAIAEPVEIRVWPKEVGADYLVARTGRSNERAAAETLSDALGGLPLAHEQAAAYCERLGVSLKDYRKRFGTAPATLLDDSRDAPRAYHNRTTVAKTFALAIAEATKLHPAAEPLIVHTALLAPEPIPLFLFAEAREKLGEPLASALAGDGLNEAVAALRTFALVDRESIADERDASVTTDCIRLHRLVRQVAAARCIPETLEAARRALIRAAAGACSGDVWGDPQAWSRVRRLEAIALGLVNDDDIPPGVEKQLSYILDYVATYRHVALGAYPTARALFERALAIDEKVLGSEHADIAASLNNLALTLRAQGDFAAARPLFERALAINEKVLGHEHPLTGRALYNLGQMFHFQDDLAAARRLYERALAIREAAGPDDPETATILGSLGLLLKEQGSYRVARPLLERASRICETVLGPEHLYTAAALNDLALLMATEGDLAGSRRLFERALAVYERVLGSEHPDTAQVRANLAYLLLDQSQPTDALPLAEAALAAHEKAIGPNHPLTKSSARVTADALDALGRGTEAAELRKRYGIEGGGKRN